NDMTGGAVLAPPCSAWLTDVAAALGHGEDQAALAEQSQRVQDRVPAHAVVLLQGLDGRQRSPAPFPGPDPPGEDGCELLICRFGQIGINRTKLGHGINLADQTEPEHVSALDWSDLVRYRDDGSQRGDDSSVTGSHS